MRVIKVKQFINFDDSEINDFLQKLQTKDFIDIKYSSNYQKGWSRENLDSDEEAYETSENITNALLIYWADFPEKHNSAEVDSK